MTGINELIYYEIVIPNRPGAIGLIGNHGVLMNAFETIVDTSF